MAYRFASVLEEILKRNEEGTLLNTKKATKFGVSVIDVRFLFFFMFLMVSLVLARNIDCGRFICTQILRIF